MNFTLEWLESMNYWLGEAGFWWLWILKAQWFRISWLHYARHVVRMVLIPSTAWISSSWPVHAFLAEKEVFRKHVNLGKLLDIKCIQGIYFAWLSTLLFATLALMPDLPRKSHIHFSSHCFMCDMVKVDSIGCLYTLIQCSVESPHSGSEALDAERAHFWLQRFVSTNHQPNFLSYVQLG